MGLEVFSVLNWKLFLAITVFLLVMSVVLHGMGLVYVRRSPEANRRFLTTFTVLECVLFLVALFFGLKLWFEVPSISSGVKMSVHVLATDRVKLSEWSQAHYSGNLVFDELRGTTSLVKNDGTVLEDCSVVYSGSPVSMSNGAVTIPAYVMCGGESIEADNNEDAMVDLQTSRLKPGK